VGLFAIPGTAAGSAQAGHEGDKFLKGGAGVGRLGKLGFRFARGAPGGLGFAFELAGHLVSDAAPCLITGVTLVSATNVTLYGGTACLTRCGEGKRFNTEDTAGGAQKAPRIL
jgi:hypothetical protein